MLEGPWEAKGSPVRKPPPQTSVQILGMSVMLGVAQLRGSGELLPTKVPVLSESLYLR